MACFEIKTSARTKEIIEKNTKRYRNRVMDEDSWNIKTRKGKK